MTQEKKINNLVIGGNLAALELAFREGYPIFYDKLDTPFHLEQTKEGLNKKDVIENYAFLLSMAGLNLSSDLFNHYRIEDDFLIVSGKTAWKIKYQFEELYDFTTEKENELVKVVDYVNIRSCGSHDIRELRTEDDFVKEIYFYPSKRVNSSKNFSLSTHNYESVTKDAILVSYLTKKQLEEEEYSPIYSRLRLKELMKEVGIKGKRCGKRPDGKIKRNAIKLEFEKREINCIEAEDRHYYYTQSKNSYLNKLFGYLYGTSSKTKKA